MLFVVWCLSGKDHKGERSTYDMPNTNDYDMPIATSTYDMPIATASYEMPIADTRYELPVDTVN